MFVFHLQINETVVNLKRPDTELKLMGNETLRSVRAESRPPLIKLLPIGIKKKYKEIVMRNIVIRRKGVRI